MITHKLCLDTEAQDRKPRESIGAISNRLTNNPIEIDIETLSHKLVQPNGKSWSPAVFNGKRKNDNWESQSVFALDFDDGMTFDLVLARLKDYGLDCTFAHTSFSDSPALAKFRVVFQVSEAITDGELRDSIQLSLMALFPGVDKSCKDKSRFFFGGKELIYQNYEYYLDIDKLIEAAQFHGIKDSSESNVSRNLGRKRRKLKLNKNGRENHSPYIYTIESVQNPSKIIDSGSVPDIVRNVDFNKIRQEVKILDDFLNPRKKLLHPQLLGLATNLRYLEGGQQLFHECLDANPAYDEEKNLIMVYCKNQDYYPMRLESFSPYEEDWEYTTLLRAAKRKEVIRLEKYNGMTIEAAREQLREVFDEVIQSDDTNVHVIRVPTGVGKTQLCTNLEKVVIAHPNHALKSEVSNRMTVEHLITPGLDGLHPSIKSHLGYYYSIGAHDEANRFLKQLSEEHEGISDYLAHCLSCYASSDTVLTTHQKAIFINWEHDTIIFDEDILSTLLPISKVTVNDLVRLSASLSNENDKSILQSLIKDITDGKVSSPREMDVTLFQNFGDIEETVLNSPDSYDSNILHFFDASYFVVDPQDSATVHYVRKYDQYLPTDKKIIILSATADETIYRHLLGDRLKFYDIGHVELTGLIEQDTKYSLSRSSLRRNSDYVTEKVGDLHTITFAGFKELFARPVEEMHFGKTTGFDDLKGQEIAVVGTPHVNPITLILYASVLGMQIRASDFSKIGQKCITHNGFRFWFNAYDNENLRQLQFYFIESELRQAVGRLRSCTKISELSSAGLNKNFNPQAFSNMSVVLNNAA